MSDEIIIDGSLGEGGGQMLRTSLAMSAITGRPLIINNIRANRPKPGLARQHLTGLELIGKICHAQVKGAEIGSTHVEFQPGRIEHGEYLVDVGTAGSITLVLQTILPVLASKKGSSQIILTGGTDVKWSPPVDYYTMVLFPILKKMGLICSLDVERRGYFPRGGGRVTATIESPDKLLPLELEPFSEPKKIGGLINITDLPLKIADRIKDAALDILPDAEIRIQHMEKGPGQGVGIVLAAMDGRTILGSSSLGERGKSAEKVGAEAARFLLAEINGGGSCDLNASDQLLPYLALAGGSLSASKLTGHASTNIGIIEKFCTEKFDMNRNGLTVFTHTSMVGSVLGP